MHLISVARLLEGALLFPFSRLVQESQFFQPSGDSNIQAIAPSRRLLVEMSLFEYNKT